MSDVAHRPVELPHEDDYHGILRVWVEVDRKLGGTPSQLGRSIQALLDEVDRLLLDAKPPEPKPPRLGPLTVAQKSVLKWMLKQGGPVQIFLHKEATQVKQVGAAKALFVQVRTEARLREYGVVVCNGRTYALTPYGRKLAKELR